jgi:hypothetical protein
MVSLGSAALEPPSGGFFVPDDRECRPRLIVALARAWYRCAVCRLMPVDCRASA